MSDPAESALPPGITAEMLRGALKAFKKRIKLSRLNEESKLGVMRPMSSGRTSQIAAMIPPDQFPRAVWDELARQGKIRHTGGGFFQLVE